MLIKKSLKKGKNKMSKKSSQRETFCRKRIPEYNERKR